MERTSKSRSPWIGMSLPSCSRCAGTAIDAKGKVCRCVDRAVFRACLERFRSCVASLHYAQPVLERVGTGPKARTCYARKNEEYMADFTLVAKRALAPVEYALFRFHFLLGADWKLCSRRLGMDRGTFFHAVYRVEEKLGRVLASLQPYPLFPLADYFRGTVRGSKAAAVPVVAIPAHTPVIPPLAVA